MQSRKRSSFVFLAIGLLMLAVSDRVVSAADQAAPNGILIMTDDQGIGDFGVMGNPVIETPHLDAMAKRSAGMTTFYVSPVCAPTRASLMTGRYNYRTRAIDTWVSTAGKIFLIAANVRTRAGGCEERDPLTASAAHRAARRPPVADPHCARCSTWTRFGRPRA